MFRIVLFSLVFIAFCLNFSCAESTQNCTNGWKQFQSKCFMFYSDKSFLSFYEAHLICKDFFNSTLVSIHSDEEQAFLTKFAFSTNKAQNHVWIGARRISNNRFVWEDNSPFNYTNWAKTQPNNLDGKHYCASLLHSPNLAEVGFWYDDPCADKYHVICQTNLKESSSNPTITSTITPITSSKQNIFTLTTKITLDHLKNLTNRTLPVNSSTIAALISSTREEPHMSHINISLIIVSIAEFLIIISLVYIVFRRTPVPYRTLVMSECSRNAQNLS